MTAVDTNILVRILTGDDARQTKTARALFSTERVWISRTVLLETDWVLGRLYGFKQNQIREAFTNLLGLPNVTVEEEEAVASALAHTRHGIEFSDALHLSARPSGARFVSFDKKLVSRARRAGIAGVAG
ncbi:MAG TPA: type II toxin-antitoxin system VapC family toxin, partial [Candidatus Solibacter sp.]|nr:type II toxin-antitoxin system VapC family toxin [Candidatus Solibacter sp.]